MMAEVIDPQFLLMTLLSNNSDPVFVKDADLRIVIANDAFLNLYPESARREIIGSDIAKWMTPEQAVRTMERDSVTLETGKSRVVDKVKMPDGNVRIYDTSRVRFEDPTGAVFVLGVRRDITERELLIEKLTNSNEELERFAFIASHDLQEPLRMVRSFTELLRTNYGEQLDETAQKYMSFTIESATHMQDLIDDLLTYARLNEDGANKKLVDVGAILNYIECNLEETINESNAQIVRGELPCFTGNSVRFLRVLQNLLVNALKYQPVGSVPKISITADDLDDCWLFKVKDNGIGMKPEQCEQIFLPFKRLHGRTIYSGTGLGLAICRRIVESLGGLIWAESEEGLGSTFTFTISKT